MEWRNQHRSRFSLFVSGLVLKEAGGGDPAAASRRLAKLGGVAILEQTDDVTALARDFLKAELVPARAVEDAFHVATATVHGMDYLLTWNCRHIANAEIVGRLADLCANAWSQNGSLKLREIQRGARVSSPVSLSHPFWRGVAGTLRTGSLIQNSANDQFRVTSAVSGEPGTRIEGASLSHLIHHFRAHPRGIG